MRLFNIHHHHYHHYPKDRTDEILSQLESLKKLIIMKETEAAAKLDAVLTTLEKVYAEVTKKLEELRAAIEAQGDVSPQVAEKLTALETAVTGVDNLIEDTPSEPEPGEENPGG